MEREIKEKKSSIEKHEGSINLTKDNIGKKI